MNSRLLFSAAVLLSLAAGAAQAQVQDIYHPKVYRNIEGPEKSAAPFGARSASKAGRMFHWQQILDNLSSKTFTIRNIGIRRDGTAPYDWRWYKVEMEIVLSTSPHSSSAASPNFAANTGKDAVVMLSRTKVFFPASFQNGTLPEPAEYFLPCG